MNDGEEHLLPLINNNDFDNSSSESEDVIFILCAIFILFVYNENEVS